MLEESDSHSPQELVSASLNQLLLNSTDSFSRCFKMFQMLQLVVRMATFALTPRCTDKQRKGMKRGAKCPKLFLKEFVPSFHVAKCSLSYRSYEYFKSIWELLAF